MTRLPSLSGRGRFSAVRRHRNSATSGCVRVHVAPNRETSHRVGFAIVGVSRAVDRNRIRRRLRAATTQALGVHESPRPIDVIVSANADAIRTPYATLAHNVDVAVNAAVSTPGRAS